MTLSTSRRARVRASAAVAVGAAVLLTGCGQSDVAAKVGDRVISENAARVAAEQIRANFDADTFGTPEAVRSLISAPLIIAAGEKAGMPFSVEAAKAAFAKTSDPSPEAIELLRANYVASQMQGQPALSEVSAELLTSKIVINPRYGTWDAKTADIVDSAPNWLKATS